MLQITPIPAFTDNYHWLITKDDDSRAYIVDPGDHEPVQQAIEQRGLQIDGILITHRHWDHVDGIKHLLARYQTDTHPIPVYGPDSAQIPQITHKLYENDTVSLFDTTTLTVWETPGHTLEHIVYVGDSENTPILFAGDTLFAAGCGRLFDGDAQQHFKSLQRMAKLPQETRVYCAHEYTLANLAFAKAVEPNNPQLQERIQQENQKRQHNIPTIPSTIALEQATNPFIRTHIDSVVQSVNQHWQADLQEENEVFAALRRWKDEL